MPEIDAATAAKIGTTVTEVSKPDPDVDLARKAANAEEAMRRMGEERDKARKELESYKAKLAKEAEDRKLAELSEVERSKLALAEKEREIVSLREAQKSAVISAEVKLVGLREGANDVSDLLAFVGRDSLEVGEDGTVKGVEEAVKALKEKKPYLFKPPEDKSNQKRAGTNPPDTTAPRKMETVGLDPQAYAAEQQRRSQKLHFLG